MSADSAVNYDRVTAVRKGEKIHLCCRQSNGDEALDLVLSRQDARTIAEAIEAECRKP